MTRPDPLRTYLTVQRKYDTRTRSILERTAKDIAKRIRALDVDTSGVGAKVRADQLRLTLKAVNDQLATMYRGQLSPAILDGQREAAEAAQRAATRLDDIIYRSVGERGAEVLLRSFQAQAERGIAVDAGRRRRELSSRVVQNLRGTRDKIEEAIRSGLIQGQGARGLARDVYRFISPSTPGGASYAAMRLARTEINNAFHEQQIRASDKPWVTGARWNLSGSHPRPDDCNAYAAANNGLGRGVYKTGDIPSKPHPQCLCYLTYETLSPSDFVDALVAGRLKAG